MATVSEVKQGLDDIARAISDASLRYSRAKEQMTRASADLGQLPSKYAGVITEVDGYTPTGAFETLAKDEKAKLQIDFVALKAKIDALKATTEYSA